MRESYRQENLFVDFFLFMVNFKPGSGHDGGKVPPNRELSLDEKREARISLYAAAMKGQTQDEALESVFREKELSESDPKLPEISSVVFGPAGKLVGGLFSAYRDWSNRVYINDIFLDHGERTEWRSAFRRVFGKTGQAQLLDLESHDKYRLAPTSGLTTALEALEYMLSDSGEESDELLAEHIRNTWDSKKHMELYRDYPTASNTEKKRINTEFGKQFATALEFLVVEAEQRMPLAAK